MTNTRIGIIIDFVYNEKNKHGFLSDIHTNQKYFIPISSIQGNHTLIKKNTFVTFSPTKNAKDQLRTEKTRIIDQENLIDNIELILESDNTSLWKSLDWNLYFKEHDTSVQFSNKFKAFYFSNYFIKKINSEFKYPSNQWPASTIYNELSEDDKRLIDEWVSIEDHQGKDKIHNDYFSKMTLARMAEKAAIHFYKELGHQVIDTAISQINKNTTDWKLYDLLLDNKIAIDVKNTRARNTNKQIYNNLIVKNFKTDTNKNKVTYTAAISPLNIFSQENETPFKPKDNIKIIGETNLNKLQKLVKVCKINFPNFELQNFENSNFSSKLPIWMFDYPANFYQNIIKNKKNVNKFLNSLSNAELNLIPEDHLIRLALTNNFIIPLALINNLTDWKKILYKNISIFQDEDLISLPSLYIALLNSFFEIIKHNYNFSPESLKSILYFEEIPHPLGINDPTESIKLLIETLTIMNNHPATLPKIIKFSSFKIINYGLIQGRALNNNSQWETIIAYCGGTRYDADLGHLTKCSTYPLIINTNETCPKCKKLICHKCGFCSSVECEGYQDREKKLDSNNFITTYTSYTQSNEAIMREDICDFSLQI